MTRTGTDLVVGADAVIVAVVIEVGLTGEIAVDVVVMTRMRGKSLARCPRQTGSCPSKGTKYAETSIRRAVLDLSMATFASLTTEASWLTSAPPSRKPGVMEPLDCVDSATRTLTAGTRARFRQECI